jgi:radical SAM superfamily enzyme YgiQ (UPF0313 family)
MYDVLLVVPPAGDRTYYPEDDSDRLGAAYLAAALKAQGVRVRVMNCQRERLDSAQAAQVINEQAPALVGLSVLFSDSELSGAIEIAGRVKASRPETCLIMGGQTFMADALMRHFTCLDAVVRGEGEGILPSLTDRVLRGRGWQDIPGLTYRQSGSGPVVSNPLPPTIPDLDLLPFPLRDVCAGGRDANHLFDVIQPRLLRDMHILQRQ